MTIAINGRLMMQTLPIGGERSEAAWPIAQATLIPAHPIHVIQMRIAVLEAELRAATSIIDDLKKSLCMARANTICISTLVKK